MEEVRIDFVNDGVIMNEKLWSFKQIVIVLQGCPRCHIQITFFQFHYCILTFSEITILAFFFQSIHLHLCHCMYIFLKVLIRIYIESKIWLFQKEHYNLEHPVSLALDHFTLKPYVLVQILHIMLSYVHQAITTNLPDLDRDLIIISMCKKYFFTKKFILQKKKHVSVILKQGKIFTFFWDVT